MNTNDFYELKKIEKKRYKKNKIIQKIRKKYFKL